MTRTNICLVVAAIAVLPGFAHAVDVSCDIPGADAAGWAVATGGDFDGDGISDIAVGAPCSFASGEDRAGRGMVFSGADGSRLINVKGSKRTQRLGASVGFVRDLDGDGRDEFVVGSSGWDIEDADGEILAAVGRVDVYTLAGAVMLSREGTTVLGNFGEAVAGIPDVTGDGVADLVVGAGDDRDLGIKKGLVYLLSGADGSVVDTSVGDFSFDSWGSTLASPGDIDGDSIADIMVASNSADVPEGGLGSGSSVRQENNGIVRVLSGQSMASVIVEVAGAPEDQLGRAVAPAGALGFFAGAPSADPDGKSKAGTVQLFSWQGTSLRTFSEPFPQPGARFGTGVSAPGDLDGDGSIDLVAAAPNATVGEWNKAGRVYAISSETAAILWSREGGLSTQKLGQALAGGPDFDGDGVADVLIGAPGDDPRGRRGAGSVTVVSGQTGARIMRLIGRRGPETRIVVAGWGVGGRAKVRGFNRRGRRRWELRRGAAYRGLRSGLLSVAVLDGSGSPVRGEMKIVLGAGHGADSDLVRILGAGRRSVPLWSFRGIGGNYSGGVTVAAGDVTGDGVEDVVVAQADAPQGIVRMRVYSRFPGFPIGTFDWVEQSRFMGFSEFDRIGVELVQADGVNVAVGEVLAGSPNREIVIGPVVGESVVRVLDSSGNILAEWLAYLGGKEDAPAVGTVVAIGDLNGDGVEEIITAPATGLPWVKAFSGDGSSFTMQGAPTNVSFLAFDASFVGGIRLAVADVDLDGKGEILVASGPGTSGIVKAFEADGTPVAGWKDFAPLGPVGDGALVIAATDRFLRH